MLLTSNIVAGFVIRLSFELVAMSQLVPTSIVHLDISLLLWVIQKEDILSWHSFSPHRRQVRIEVKDHILKSENAQSTSLYVEWHLL